jgi:mRNA interferase MazF
MHKDFDNWNQVKKNTHYSTAVTNIFFREKDVWWCKLGINVGHEQDGKGHSFRRPVIIVKKFNRSVFLAIPLSLILKEGPYRILVKSKDGIHRMCIISQIRLLDIHRLEEKLFTIQDIDFQKIKKALRDLFP